MEKIENNMQFDAIFENENQSNESVKSRHCLDSQDFLNHNTISGKSSLKRVRETQPLLKEKKQVKILKNREVFLLPLNIKYQKYCLCLANYWGQKLVLSFSFF